MVEVVPLLGASPQGLESLVGASLLHDHHRGGWCSSGPSSVLGPSAIVAILVELIAARMMVLLIIMLLMMSLCS